MRRLIGAYWMKKKNHLKRILIRSGPYRRGTFWLERYFLRGNQKKQHAVWIEAVGIIKRLFLFMSWYLLTIDIGLQCELSVHLGEWSRLRSSELSDIAWRRDLSQMYLFFYLVLTLYWWQIKLGGREFYRFFFKLLLSVATFFTRKICFNIYWIAPVY